MDNPFALALNDLLGDQCTPAVVRRIEGEPGERVVVGLVARAPVLLHARRHVVVGRDRAVLRALLGTLQHNAYHAGQIALLRKQGEPNGYIVGREGGGALLLGVRYGSGTLHHKVEGTRPVYWTGPSLGLDLGANAGNTFVLVYNLYNTDEIFNRFAAGEGQAYLVGGFNVSYLRRGDVVLIPVRMGVGLRLGINAGYMKFSKKQKLSPF